MKKSAKIFEQWKADLLDKDKKMSNVSSNFDDLFYELYQSEIGYDEAREILNDAVKAHSPNTTIMHGTYVSMKRRGMEVGAESDFMKNWCEKIKDKALQSFYSFYAEKEEVSNPTTGSISKQEYSRQRRYAESYPVLTEHDINSKYKEMESFLNWKDFDDEI